MQINMVVYMIRRKHYKKINLNLFFLILIIFTYSSLEVNSSLQKPVNGWYTSQITEIGWHQRKIDNERAWEITQGSKNITVAVLDSGIDFNHSELLDIAWINSDEIANNSIDDDLNGFVDDVNGWDFVSNDKTPGPEETDPIHWHATFIAGIIAAPFDGTGVAGVAPNVSVMDIRVLKLNNYLGVTNQEFGDSIRYAVDNGADVISLSLHYMDNSSLYYDDILYAISQNVVIVSVTGNNWIEYGGGFEYKSFPGGFEEVISVGATNYYDMKADYSNYGPWTELVAPVGDQGTGIRSTALDDSYFNGWGTSFACPQVAAVVAMIKSLNSTKSVAEIREILHKTAIDLGEPGKDNYFGYGMLNASAALMETINPSVDGERSYLYVKIFVPITSVLVIVSVVVLILVRRKI